MSILLKSALKEAVDVLPDALKPNQIVPVLKKAGVKDEEIQLSGIGVVDYGKLSKDEKGRIASKYAKSSELMREDSFSLNERTGGNARFSEITPGGYDVSEQGYRERVYRFAHPEQVVSGSSHFDDKSYLMHTRVYDDLIGDQDTRVVAEIQSDLHQNNKADASALIEPSELKAAIDYMARNTPEEELSSLKLSEYVQRILKSTKESYRHTEGVNLPTLEELEKIGNSVTSIDDYAEQVSALVTVPKKAAAWETSWARKGLENEIMTAMQEGKSQIAIPIKNAPGAERRPLDLSAAIQTAQHQISNLPDPDVEDFTWEADDRAVQSILDSLPASLRGPDADDVREVVRDLVNDRASPEDIAMHLASLDRPSQAEELAAGVGGLMRGEGAQKWYETYVGPLAQKLAKQTNSEFKTEVKEGVEYATIKFGPDTKADFKLYSAGGGLAAYMAYQQGYSEDEVAKYMREEGFGEDEIATANAQQAQIAEAKAQGYSDEEIKVYLESQQPKAEPQADIPTERDGTPAQPGKSMPTEEKKEAIKAVTSGRTLPADELLANLQVISPDMSSVTTRIAAFFGNDEAVRDAKATEEAAIANIQALGKERGLDFSWDGEEWTVNTESGPQIVTPGLMKELAAAGGELVGGTGGAIYGARAGSAIGGVNPLAKAAAATAGAAIGGIVGSAAGTQFDYMFSAMQLQEQISAEVAAHKALTAAEAAAYGEIVGLGLYKTGSGLWKGAVRAKDFLLDGNSEGARKALRDTMFLTDSEIDEIVEQFSKTVDTTGMSRAQQEITAVATTLPGAEDLVRAATTIDATASRSVVRSIDNRAKQLAEEVDKVGVDNAGKVLKEDLDAYTAEVKQFYGDVKKQAAEAPRAKYYKFNMDKVAVVPVLESLTDNISNPATRERFLLRMKQVRKYAKGRTFADLIELRQAVNEFRFNSKIVNAKDFKAIDNVLQNIDERIESGAKFVMNKPQDWLDDFSLARSKYSQMMGLQKNALVKTLNRPGVTPEQVSSNLLKLSNSIDGTYERVMEVLPKSMRELAEADMLRTLATKYTAGEVGGMNAVQFPMFAEDLASRTFVSEHAREMKGAITQLADTFKNDVMLSKHTGLMRVPQFQSYLTADPVVRAKFELASTVFNKIKQSIPGSKASREIALVRLTADFLEKPLNAKTVGALKEAAKDTVAVDDAILSVQREQAEAIAKGMDGSGVKVPVYGSGSVLSTAGSGQATMEIPAHRIADQATVKSVADAEGITVDSKAALDSALKRYGFKAVQYGSDKVRVLK